MKTSSRALLFLGGFLIIAGIAGYASNPEEAKTALFSGGFFGFLCIVWGMLCRKGLRFAWFGGFATLILLTAAFVWRSSVGWIEVADGNQAKIFAASLISAMLLATLAAASRMLKDRNRPIGGVEPPSSTA